MVPRMRNSFFILWILVTLHIREGQRNMKVAKRTIKENKIIAAAEEVMGQVGFKNAKMDDIALACGITKVTVYAYFQSKENLYMAIVFKALQELNDEYYITIEKNKNHSGLESALALTELFMNFCERNFLYSEALLDYFSLIRSSSTGKDSRKLTEGIKDSLYFKKAQDIQNLPFKLVVNEIERGKLDGSINKDIDAMLITLDGWTTSLGYAKIIAASGGNAMPLFHVELDQLKTHKLEVIRKTLMS